MADRPDSVLILRLSALGDVVHTLPALAHLRQELPDARIGWVVEERCEPLLAGHPHLDRLFVVPRKQAAAAARLWKLAEAARLLGRVVSEIRADRYAVACDFQGNAKSAFVGLVSKAAVRLGFAPPDCKEGSHLFTTQRVEALPSRLNRIEKYIWLARAAAGMGAASEPERVAAPVVPVDDEARARAEAWWDTQGERPRILLAPGSSARMPEKRWPAAHYGALATVLRAATAGTVATTFGLGEGALVGPVSADCAALAHPIAPPPLAELVALIATCDLFIGNDSAPTHIAAQLAKPTVAIFGPTDPALFSPWGPRVHVVQADTPCAACARGAARGDDTHDCLAALAPPIVAEAALAAIG